MVLAFELALLELLLRLLLRLLLELRLELLLREELLELDGHPSLMVKLSNCTVNGGQTRLQEAPIYIVASPVPTLCAVPTSCHASSS